MPQLTNLGRFDFQRGSSRGQDHRYHWERTTVFTDVVAGTLEVNRGVPPTKRWIRANSGSAIQYALVLVVAALWRAVATSDSINWSPRTAFLASRQVRASMQPRFSLIVMALMANIHVDKILLQNKLIQDGLD